jgi:Flp pilus assembly protein TadD
VAYLRGRDMSAAHEAGVEVSDPSRSFDGYLEAMRRDPNFQEAQDRVLSLALDFALGGQGPSEAARSGCERLLQLDAKAFKAHAALAEIDLAQGHVVAAIEHLRQSIAIRPDWVPAFERLGTALLRDGKYAEARGWLERAVKERPDDSDALQSLGVALAETGNLEGAVTAFQGALEKGGHSVALHENLARALTELGRHKEAREQRELARKLAGKPPSVGSVLRSVWSGISRFFGGEQSNG